MEHKGLLADGQKKHTHEKAPLALVMFGLAELLGDIARFESDLEAMQASGKVDVKVDSALEKIVAFVSQREQFWSQGDPSPMTFAIYHSWRNLRLIFSKMRVRFANSQLVHDNPVVVDQARETVPNILALLPSLASLEGDPSQNRVKQVLQYVKRLRDVASEANMIEPKEELKEVDRTQLIEAFDRLLTPMASSNEA